MARKTFDDVHMRHKIEIFMQRRKRPSWSFVNSPPILLLAVSLTTQSGVQGSTRTLPEKRGPL